jgi:hypothetical protein
VHQDRRWEGSSSVSRSLAGRALSPRRPMMVAVFRPPLSVRATDSGQQLLRGSPPRPRALRSSTVVTSSQHRRDGDASERHGGVCGHEKGLAPTRMTARGLRIHLVFPCTCAAVLLRCCAVHAGSSDRGSAEVLVAVFLLGRGRALPEELTVAHLSSPRTVAPNGGGHPPPKGVVFLGS